METDALKATEAECAEGRTAPRVSLADLEANIERAFYFTGGEAAIEFDPHTARAQGVAGLDVEIASLRVLTICLMVTRNGFTIIGKSAPASPENFDRELGEKLAYEDAVRQLWPLMGYALRERLAGAD